MKKDYIELGTTIKDSRAKYEHGKLVRNHVVARYIFISIIILVIATLTILGKIKESKNAKHQGRNLSGLRK